MKVDDIWDAQWGLMEKNAVKETAFDSFAKKAFPCISQWITSKDKKIIEAGSGTGRYCIALAREYKNSMIIGMDISRNALKLTRKGMQCRGIENLYLVQGDAFRMPFKNDAFDVVYNDGVIEHFINYNAIVNEMVRLTRKKGQVIVAVPNWYCFPHTLYKKIVGKRYVYGYEKSFKKLELIQTFKLNNLYGIEHSGFNPAHSICRLSRLLVPFGKLIDLMFIMPLDKLTNNKISKTFGIEIVIKGVKK
jgi:SAM-dependent methyltransferase